MKLALNLISKNLESMKNKDWYHQRFDGAPLFLDFISEAELRREVRKNEVGGVFKSHIIWFSNGVCDWYIEQDDIKRVSRNLCCLAKKNIKNDFSKKLMKKWKKDEDKFFRESKKLDEIDFSKLTDEQLKILFNKYCKIYLNSITSSSIIDGFALGTDELIQKVIADFLKKKGLEKMQHQYFTSLTAPVTQSFISEAEISLLKVANLVASAKDYKKALTKHTKNYFWTKNNYNSSFVVTENDFLEEINAMLKGTNERVNFRQVMERIKNTPHKNKKEKSKIIKKINLPKYIKNLITISEDFTYWQDERKKKTFLMTNYGFKFLDEIGKRNGYQADDLKYMIFSEIIDLLNHKKVVERSEIKNRKQGCLVYDRIGEYEIISGLEAEKIKRQILDKEAEATVNDFRGMPASRGRVRGFVKVVMSVNELNKIEPGDILVTVMTRPDYVSGIKKSAAIITEEGGVTCHAAIISRELGIPCVIGTKIATRVLKDGDEVEVNANHGVVTIIKRK